MNALLVYIIRGNVKHGYYIMIPIEEGWINWFLDRIDMLVLCDVWDRLMVNTASPEKLLKYMIRNNIIQFI